MNQLFSSEVNLNKENIIKFAQKLIQTPSITGNEKDIAHVILNKLNELNYDETYIDEIGNVVGIMKGKEKGLNSLFMSHMDHSGPGELEQWKFDPYNAKISEESIYGIGSSDSKGAIASQIYAGYFLKEKDLLNKGDYIVSFVVQEGLGCCFGTKNLFEKTFIKKNIKVDFAILGNSTSLDVYVGQRGRAELQIEVYGLTCNSGLPWLGINALEKGLLIIKELNELSKTLPSSPTLGKSSLAVTNVKTLPERGGCIPDRCVIDIDRRFLNNETKEDILNQIQSIIDKLSENDKTLKATLKIKNKFNQSYNNFKEKTEVLMLPFLTDENDDLINKICLELQKINKRTDISAWFFNTDGGYIANHLNIKTIGYSPGDEKLYKTPFEKVDISDLLDATSGNALIYKTLNQ